MYSMFFSSNCSARCVDSNTSCTIILYLMSQFNLLKCPDQASPVSSWTVFSRGNKENVVPLVKREKK